MSCWEGTAASAVNVKTSRGVQSATASYTKQTVSQAIQNSLSRKSGYRHLFSGWDCRQVDSTLTRHFQNEKVLTAVGVVVRLWGDAHVVVRRELGATEHFRPGVAVHCHATLAALLYFLAETPARINRAIQANGTKQGAQKQLGIGVATDVVEGHPRTRLMGDFCHRVMVQQVGKSHLVVPYPVAQTHVAGYVHTGRLSGATPGQPPRLEVASHPWQHQGDKQHAGWSHRPPTIAFSHTTTRADCLPACLEWIALSLGPLTTPPASSWSRRMHITPSSTTPKPALTEHPPRLSDC